MIITNRKKIVYCFNTYDEFKKYLFDNFLSNSNFKEISNEIDKKLYNIFTLNSSLGIKHIKNIKYNIVEYKNPLQINYWKERGWSEIESKQKIYKIQSKNSKKLYEKKKQNPENYDSINQNQIKYWIKKGYSEEESKKKVSERQSVFSKEKLIKKYGEYEGLNRLNERNNKWINSLYSNNDMNIVNKSKAITLENQIKKKGIEEGIKCYNDYIMKQRKITIEKLKNSKLKFKSKASKQSIQIFLDFYKKMVLLFDENKIFLGVNNKTEFYINYDNKIYFYDFVIKPLNLIFEYNGSHVHPNKKLLSTEQWNDWKNVFTKENADTVYQKNQEKFHIAEMKGFKVIELWDSDTIEYNKKIVSESIIQELQKFL